MSPGNKVKASGDIRIYVHGGCVYAKIAIIYTGLVKSISELVTGTDLDAWDGDYIVYFVISRFRRMI